MSDPGPDPHPSDPHPFDADTAVAATGEGRWSATISDRWDTPGGPNGGYSLAAVVRALGATLPHPHPFVVSATFLRPVRHGDAEIVVEPIRAGRRLSSGEARLVQDGREVIRVLASFTDLEAAVGPSHDLASPPDLPPPDDCAAPFEGGAVDDGGTGFSIGRRFEYRTAAPFGFGRGTPSGRAAFALWMRFAERRDPDVWSLPSFVDGAPPAVMELGETASSTIELTLHVRRVPAPGWLALQVTTQHVIGGFHEEDIDVWDSEGRLVAQSRQLALLPAPAER